MLVLPSTKTGRRLQPLSTPVVALLACRPRINEFIFTNGRTAVTYKHIRRVFAIAAKDAKLKDVRFHDLRRTVMTNAAASGIGVHVLRDLLGHKTTAMADRYIRQTGGALVEATERTGASMAAMLNGGQADKLLRQTESSLSQRTGQTASSHIRALVLGAHCGPRSRPVLA